MLVTKKTIEKKTGKTWTTESIIDSDIVNVLLNDDMIAKYLFKSPQIKIKYLYGGRILVNYCNGTRAIYE